MATVEGIRAPIVLDLTNIAAGRAALKKQMEKVKKDVGKVDLKLDGKYFEDFNRKTLQRLIKNFTKLEDKALRLKASIKELGKAMATVRSGRGISKGQADAFASMPGVGGGTREALAKYKKTQASFVEDPGSDLKKGKMVAAQQKLLHLLKQAEGVNKRNLELTKQHLNIKMEYAKKVQPMVNRHVKEEMKENSKLFEKMLAIDRLNRKGRTTLQERIQLSQILNKLHTRKVALTKEQLRTMRMTTKEAKKAGQGASAMSGNFMGRVKWFAQLRLLWGGMRLVADITEQMLELDRATARAMRTMVRGAKEYEKVAKKVRQTIIDTSRLTGATYENIGEALYQLSSAGLSAQQALDAVASTVKLATITEAGMTDTTKVVAGAFNNFKDTITGASNQTEKFMKISGTLSYVWKRNQIDMNELVQGLNQSAQSGKLAGLQFEELSVILGNLGTRMIRSGRAGRMFRSAVINIAQKSDKVKAAFDIAFDVNKPLDFMAIMDKMSVKWEDSNKTAQVTAALFDIFGKRGAPALIAMLDSWKKIREEVDGLGEGLDLAVKQHETMLMTQTHYKQITEVLWREALGLIAEYLDYTKLIKGVLLSITNHLRMVKIHKQNKKSIMELSEQYKSAGSATERLVELTAIYNIKKAEGYKDNEVMMKNLKGMISKMTQLKERYDAQEKAETSLAEAKKRNLLATSDLTRGYAIADAVLSDLNVKNTKVAQTMDQLYQNGLKAAKVLANARTEYAKAYTASAKEIGEIPPAVTQALEQANKEYINLRDRYNKMRENIVNSAKAPGHTRPRRQGITSGEGEFETAMKPEVLATQNDALEKQLGRKRDMLNAEEEFKVLMRERNLTDKETEALDREAALVQLEFEEFALERKLAMIQERMVAEEEAAALAEFSDPDKAAVHLANLQSLQQAEVSMEQQRGQNAQAQARASMTYDQYQKKRIEGIYAEKGAMAAAKGMWKSYGDVIGSHASSMADQWKTMFAEMGKESKAAWIAYQAIAISQAIIDTYKTAQAGASALAGIPFVGPALAGMWIATSVATGMMRVQQIRSQKPQSAAHGGVFDGSLQAYGDGGVTSGVATGIIGDNPSGKELVIPSENINKDNVSGYIQEGGGGGEVTVVNMVTQTDIAQAMSESEEGQNVVINTIGRDMNEKGSTYNTMKKSNKKDQ